MDLGLPQLGSPLCTGALVLQNSFAVVNCNDGGGRRKKCFRVFQFPTAFEVSSPSGIVLSKANYISIASVSSLKGLKYSKLLTR